MPNSGERATHGAHTHTCLDRAHRAIFSNQSTAAERGNGGCEDIQTSVYADHGRAEARLLGDLGRHDSRRQLRSSAERLSSHRRHDRERRAVRPLSFLFQRL